MKFFEEHLTIHHFFHAPHKWFLALLISPIHAAEMHYKRNYHLRFAHARKLFLFDIKTNHLKCGLLTILIELNKLIYILFIYLLYLFIYNNHKIK